MARPLAAPVDTYQLLRVSVTPPSSAERPKEGTEAYAVRSYSVEPVFGDTKDNRGFRRFVHPAFQLQTASRASASLHTAF